MLLIDFWSKMEAKMEAKWRPRDGTNPSKTLCNLIDFFRKFFDFCYCYTQALILKQELSHVIDLAQQKLVIKDFKIFCTIKLFNKFVIR